MSKILKALLLVQALFLFAQGFAQQRVWIRGKVTSPNEQGGLPGVTVVELDKNNRITIGTVTNMDGEYALEVLNPNDKLQFSFVGFKDQVVEIKGRTTINVVLLEDVHEIAGVEVVAQKRTNTGIMTIADRDMAIPIAKISAEDIEDVQASSIDEALQGRLAGVDIATNSGDPGAGMSIRIRGVSTLSANAQPLIVVDNMPYETNISPDFDFGTANEEGYSQMLNIAVDDIKEITVLKDAAATAMWGTKAANGVLLITTKRGVKGRKPVVSYSYKGTFVENPPHIPLLSGDEYSTLMLEAYQNSYGMPMPTDVRKEFLRSPDDPYYYYNYGQNTDWMAAVTREGYTHNHDFSITGGGNKASYRFSANYMNQTGTTIGTGLDRMSTRLNLDYTVSDKVRLRADFAYTHSYTEGNYTDDYIKNDRSVRSIAYKKMPNMSIYEYDAYGNKTGNYFSPESNAQGAAPGSYNPVALANLGFNHTYNDRVTSKLSVFYDIIEGLRYTIDMSLDVNTNKVKKFLPDDATGIAFTNSYANRAFDKDDDSYYIYTSNKLDFNRTINEIHRVTLGANFTTYESIGNNFDILTANSASAYLTDPSIQSNVNDAGLGASSGPWRGRTVGTTAWGHYVLMDRYILGASLRYEGNSKFDANNRWGFFPGVSAAWRLSGEQFMKKFTKINDLRLRYSYGVTGNPPGKEGMFFNNYSTFGWNYLGYSAVYSTNMKLENLKWETKKMTNYGVTLEMYDTRLQVNADYYLTRVEDMFGQKVGISTSSGYSQLSIMNLGTMDNEGWELDVKTMPIKTKNWKMTFDFNISKNYNILRKVADSYPLERNATLRNGLYKNIVQMDNPIGSFYGYKYKGVYTRNDDLVARDVNGNQILDPNGNPIYMMFDYDNTRYQFQLGDAMYEDINHDGNINAQDIVYLGNANPDFFGGFGSMITYKNFSFNYFFHYRVGNDIINITRMNGESMYSYDNQLSSVLSRWRKPGDETDIPRAMMNRGYNWLGSDRFVEDGTFVRLKYITFSYRVPKKYTEKMGLESLRLSTTLNNPFTFTEYSGQDPDISINSKDGTIYTVGYDYSQTPRAREITFNVALTF